MSYPSPALNIAIPVWYKETLGSEIEMDMTGGTLSLSVVSTFEWGDVQASWAMVTTISAPVKPGFDGPLTYRLNAQRLKTADSTWVNPSGGGPTFVSWAEVAAAGGTGGFRITYPAGLVDWTQAAAGNPAGFGFDDSAFYYEIWPSDVTDGGITPTTPAKFTVAPGVRLVLNSIADPSFIPPIDGGTP